MAQHEVKKNNIFYIIPNDELYEKYRNDEAFIDEYGRLMNRKPYRVLKELKHYANNEPRVPQQNISPPVSPKRESSPVIERFKDTVRENAMETIHDVGSQTLDLLFDKVIPYVWHEYIVPLPHRIKEAYISKKQKVDVVHLQTKKSAVAAETSRPITKMTQEEAETERLKVLYHWLNMLNSLKRLHDAGEIDYESILNQLINPVTLDRVNVLLSEKPNLLGKEKYIELRGLLGRELYKNKQLIPIDAEEIKKLAVSYETDVKSERSNSEKSHSH